MPCYVLGCAELPTIGAIHRRFGRVNACPDHDPSRHAYAEPWPEPSTMPAEPSRMPQETPDEQPPTSGPSGGSKVPRTPVAPRKGPSFSLPIADPF